MRVSGSKKIGPTQGVKPQKQASQGANFAAGIDTAAPTATASGVTGTAPISSIDAMLTIQSVDPDGQSKSAGIQSAGDVLDALEQVRRGILLGAIPVGRLKQLSSRLQQRMQHISDPQLTEIMTDIVLRARVELAKAGIYS